MSDRSEIAARQNMMRICAEAKPDELGGIVADIAAHENVSDLRHPEKGLVMLRGRIGGEGAPFNVGEATVVRAAVRLGDGTQGFAYHLGRDAKKARNAAIIDAVWQRATARAGVEAALRAIAGRLVSEAKVSAEQTAATRVEFFTMTRGED